MGKKVKIEYFVTGFLFSLLFITLLRSRPPMAGGFIPASLSPIEGRPVRSSQGGLIDRKVRGALSIARGGPVAQDTARPVISTPTHGEGGLGPSLDSPPLFDWLDELLDRIQQVESGGQRSEVRGQKIPDGDNGRAVGALQIHKCVVDDVNRYYKTNFSYCDRSDFPKARLIARLYIQMWMERHREEIASMIFHYGPSGWRKKDIHGYWEKVRGQRSDVRSQKSEVR